MNIRLQKEEKAIQTIMKTLLKGNLFEMLLQRILRILQVSVF